MHAKLEYFPDIGGIAPIEYTTPSADGVATTYRLIETLATPSNPGQITPVFTTATTSFLFVNLDPDHTVTIVIIPTGQVADNKNRFTVAAGGWIGGTISLTKNQLITIGSTNPAGSRGLFYMAGD